MMKLFVTLATVLTIGSCTDWWDPLGLANSHPNQSVLAKLTPAVQQSIPESIQKQMAQVTVKDLIGLRALAERMTQNPTSRAEFVKELNSKAPNVLFLGTEIYKVGREQYQNTRKNLSSGSMKFLQKALSEVSAAVNEAASMFNKQDVGTKKNLQSVFPFIPQLIQSSKNSIQYVSKNL